MMISRYTEIRGNVHDIAIVHRSAWLEEGRYSLQLPNDRRKGYSSVSTADPKQLSLLHGCPNVGISVDL